MAGAEPFAYAVLRIVPDIARGESLNAAVVVFSRRADYLALWARLPVERLRAIAPQADVEAIAAHLDALERVALGDPAAGPVAGQPRSERFHWLVAPSSTVIQPSAVHTGLCDDPAETLDRLFEQLVA